MTRNRLMRHLEQGVAVEGASGFPLGLGGGRLLIPLCERGSDLSKLGAAAAVGQKAIMTNPHQACYAFRDSTWSNRWFRRSTD